MKIKTATPILVVFILFAHLLYAKGSFAPAIQVDDMIITQYEIDQRSLFFELLKFPGNHKKEAEKSLIDDRLKLRASEKFSVRKPIIVVKLVKKTGQKLTLIDSLIAAFFSEPFLISLNIVVSK